MRKENRRQGGRILAFLLALTVGLMQLMPTSWGEGLSDPNPSLHGETEQTETNSQENPPETGEADPEQESLVNGGLMDTTGQASLTEISVDAGTLIWDKQGGKLTLPADAEGVRLCLWPAAAEPYHPTAAINGEPVKVEEETELCPVEAGAVKKLEIVTKGKDGSSCTYPLYVHRTKASFTLETGTAEYRESLGKRVFSVTLQANSGFAMQNLSLSLAFDPAKLALAHYKTGEKTPAVQNIVEALPALAGAERGFLNQNDPTSEDQWGYLFPSGSRADNTRGLLQIEAAPNHADDGPYVTQEGEDLLRIWFQIQDESLAFDVDTLKLAVKLAGVEPQEGIRVSEPLTNQALASFESANRGMVRFSNLESLYEAGDISAGGGGAIDLSEPYFGDTLLSVNDPYDASGLPMAGAGFLQGEGVFFSEEQGEAALLSGSGETGAGGDAGAGGPMVSAVEKGEKGQEVQVLSYVPDFEAEGDTGPATLKASAADLPVNLLLTDLQDATYTDTFQQLSFYLDEKQEVKSTYTPAEMRLFGSTEHLYLWYDPKAAGMDKLDKSDLERLVVDAEQACAALTEQFGPIWDKDGNGKLDILLYDISDLYSQTSSYYQGLFDPLELFGTADGGRRGNDRDVLHLDTNPTFSQSEQNYEGDALFATLSTLVHEGQHLTLASNVKERGGKVTTSEEQARWTPVWLNEGLSVMAEHILVGPVKRRLDDFGESSLIYNGRLGLAQWDQKNAMDSYALSYVFLGWLYAQARAEGMTDQQYASLFYNRDYRYEGKQLAEIANGISSLKNKSTRELLRDFALAVYLKDGEGVYGFRGDTDFDTARVKVSEKTSPTLVRGGVQFSQLAASGFTPEWGAEGTSSSVAFAGIGSPGGTVQLTVRTDPQEGGTVTQSQPNGSVDRGEQVQLTAKPKEGYVFTGWSGDISPKAGRWNSLSVVMARDKSLTAAFAKEGQEGPDDPADSLSVKVTAAPPKGGQVMVTAPGYGARYTDDRYGLCTAAYRIFTELKLTAQPAAGYGLAGWYLDGAETPCSTEESISYQLVNNLSLEARFVETTEITAQAKSQKGGTILLSIDGVQAASGPALSGQWRQGSAVRLTAQTKAGYAFLGWYAEPAAGGKPRRLTVEELLAFTLDPSWLSQWKPNFTASFRRQIEPGGEFEPMDPLTEAELKEVLSVASIELLERNPEKPGALVLASRNGEGSLTAALELSIPDSTVSGGAVLRSAADVPKTQAVRLTAKAQPGFLFTGWELVKKESGASAAVRTASETASGGRAASEEAAAQTAAAVTEYDTRESIELVLGDYVSVRALTKEAGSEMPSEQAALADLRVTSPGGRQLIQRGVTGAQRVGYTGSVEEYDLYLMAAEDSLTLTPYLYSDAYTARVKWGDADWSELRIPPSAGETEEVLVACEPLQLSLESEAVKEQQLVIEVTWTGWQGSTPVQESRKFTIHVHCSPNAGADPLMIAEVAKAERAAQGAEPEEGAVAEDAAAQSKVTVKLQHAKAAGAQLTLELSSRAALTTKDGMSAVDLGQTEVGPGQSEQTVGSVRSVTNCLTLMDDRFSLAAARLERLEDGGQRLSVSLLPKDPEIVPDIGAAQEILFFYITGDYADLAIPKAAEGDGSQGANVNVIADAEKGELRERTVLQEKETALVQVTGLLLSCNPSQYTTISMICEDVPGRFYEVQIPADQAEDGSEAAKAARQQARQKEAAVQSFQLEVAANSRYTIQFRKEGSLYLKLTNLWVGAEDRNLNDWLAACAAQDQGLAEKLADQMTDAGVLELLTGDLDDDGVVSALDRVALTNAAHYGRKVKTAEGASIDDLVKYDLDGDGSIRAFDVRLIERHYGKRANTLSLPAVIEP